MSEYQRLDIALTAAGLADSRSRANTMIRGGNVCVNGKVCTKSSAKVTPQDELSLCGELPAYVSRGGYKLEKAIRTFGLNLDGLICMDVGASTGGFTDCMLQNGASLVYAVDVGTDQLSPLLRENPRVVVREQCNFRYLTLQDIDSPLDFASVDVSFISLTVILPVLKSLLKPGAQAVCLIKPQFEAGREGVGKNGVVKSNKVHCEVLRRIYDTAVSLGFSVQGLTFSPIKGPKGNIEYLIYLSYQNVPSASFSFGELVEQAHRELDGD